MRARIAVFVSGNGTNLQALINAQKDKKLKSGKICLVISSKKDAYALKRAKRSGISRAVVMKSEFKSPEEYENELSLLIKEYKIDLIVLAGFMQILSADFVKKYEGRIINIHPSLIPSFCGKGFYGLGVHKAALDYGVKVTGATVHFVNEIPDAGKIIMQKSVKVKENDTPEKLQKRVMRSAEWKILPKACEEVSACILKEKNNGEN